MHPIGVASATWVLAAAPSKAPFYVAAGLLASWAVAAAAVGLTHPQFPGSTGRARLVMLTSALLVGATIVTAVTTASTPRASTARSSGTAAPSGTLQLAADPTGKLAYDTRAAVVQAGSVSIGFTNRSPLPHNVTVAVGSRVVAATRTIQGGVATLTADLPPGDYVFFCSVDAHRQAGMQGTLTAR
jgi:plastocyanin